MPLTREHIDAQEAAGTIFGLYSFLITKTFSGARVVAEEYAILLGFAGGLIYGYPDWTLMVAVANGAGFVAYLLSDLIAPVAAFFVAAAVAFAAGALIVAGAVAMAICTPAYRALKNLPALFEKPQSAPVETNWEFLPPAHQTVAAEQNNIPAPVLVSKTANS